MNQIPYYNPTVGSNFPDHTILKDKDHAGGWTDYYVFLKRKFVRVKRVNRKGRHCREIHELKSAHGEHLKVKSGWWNPVKHRIDDGSYYLNVEKPAEFVEMKPWEAYYAKNR